jgi:sugar lactone lactonase YvrE
MSRSRALSFTLATVSAAVLAGCVADAANSADGMVMGNSITGEGIPNPAPTTAANWGQLPAGRPMGTSAGMDIDPNDGHVWTYERCGQGALNAAPATPPAGGGGGGGGGFGGANCSTDPTHPPVYKFDRNTGEILANFGAGVMVTPHGIGVDPQGNVWVTDFARSADGTKGHQVHKFSPTGELLMSLGIAGTPGNADGQFNEPNDVIVAPDGSIFVSDGHSGQGMTTQQALNAGREAGQTARISKFSPDGTFISSWGQLGTLHGEFRTPHSMAFDSQGRLWVADRGNHRLEIFDQEGNYLDSRYQYGRISGVFITPEDMVYAIDSESGALNHTNWVNGVRIGHVDSDWITGFIPAFPAETRPYQGAAGEGIAVDADGNVFAAEGPNSMRFAGGPFTKYSVAGGM